MHHLKAISEDEMVGAIRGALAGKVEAVITNVR